jgi:hypothetical protein
MPSLSRTIIGKGATRVPGLKRLPVFKLLAIGEIAILARRHIELLEPDERRRLIELVRKGRGRRVNLTQSEQRELTALIAKVEPKRFALLAADKLSPIPVPKRLTRRADPPSSR